MDSAIEMFFRDGDVVSQHTLAMAAHGIVHDIARQKGVGGSIKDSPHIRPELRGEFIKAVHLPQNFFKHANRDARGKLVFRHNGSHFWLFDALRLFILLGGQVTHAMKVFLMWFQLRYPDLLCFEPAEEDLRAIRNDTSNPATFKLLARVLLDGARQNREA
jgi:hypothetical protein